MSLNEHKNFNFQYMAPSSWDKDLAGTRATRQLPSEVVRETDVVGKAASTGGDSARNLGKR